MGRKTKLGLGAVVGLVILGALVSEEEPATPPENTSVQVETLGSATPTHFATATARPRATATKPENTSVQVETLGSATPTHFATATARPRATATKTESSTKTRVTEKTYYATVRAHVRPCPELSCAPLGQVNAGDKVTVTGATTGEAVAGNSQWFQTSFGGRTAYIHSSVVTEDRPAPPAPSSEGQETSPKTSDSGASGKLDTGPVTGPTTFTCPRNCEQAIQMGLTAEQAGQCPNLDRDKDGVACYGD